MRKATVLMMAVLMVLALVGLAIAEKFKVETVPLNILGKEACMVRTVRQGGPLNGLLGNTSQAQQTYAMVNGQLTCLSSSNSSSDGLGKAALVGVPQAAMLGGMQIIAAGQIRPDRNTVNVPVSVKGTSSSSQTQGQIGINAQAQGQLQAQGQAQGQIQGQAQGQAQAQQANGFVPPGQQD